MVDQNHAQIMEWLHGIEDRRKRARRASDAEREWIAEEIRKAIEGEQRHEWRAVGAEVAELMRCAKCGALEIRQIAIQLTTHCGSEDVVEGLRRALQVTTGSRD